MILRSINLFCIKKLSVKIHIINIILSNEKCSSIVNLSTCVNIDVIGLYHTILMKEMFSGLRYQSTRSLRAGILLLSWIIHSIVIYEKIYHSHIRRDGHRMDGEATRHWLSVHSLSLNGIND